MSVQNFKPEVWSASLIVALRKSTVYSGLCNRNYEGEIANYGDTVHVTSPGRPTVNDYTPYSSTVTPEHIIDAGQTLVVDRGKSWAFDIDDIDRRQAMTGLVEATMDEAAYALADEVDQYIASFYTSIPTTNSVNSGSAVQVTTGDLAYTQLTKLNKELNEANVPTTGRWVVIPPWYEQLLTDTTKFTSAADSGSTETLRNGFVGRAAGFDILVSNNVPLVTGDDYAIMAGTNAAMTMAEQIVKTEAIRSTTAFADILRGLHLYGAKVIRPDGLACLLASVT